MARISIWGWEEDRYEGAVVPDYIRSDQTRLRPFKTTFEF